MAALNDLDVKCSGVQNAYLNTKPKEMLGFLSGQEFCIHMVIEVVFIRDIYGVCVCVLTGLRTEQYD